MSKWFTQFTIYKIFTQCTLVDSGSTADLEELVTPTIIGFALVGASGYETGTAIGVGESPLSALMNY